VLNELIENESGQFKTELQASRTELVEFINRLRAVDFNLVAASLDPETATSYLQIAGGHVLLVADTLKSDISTNC
jgi:hypothetical protein